MSKEHGSLHDEAPVFSVNNDSTNQGQMNSSVPLDLLSSIKDQTLPPQAGEVAAQRSKGAIAQFEPRVDELLPPQVALRFTRGNS